MAKYLKMKCNCFHVHAWVKLGFLRWGEGGTRGITVRLAYLEEPIIVCHCVWVMEIFSPFYCYIDYVALCIVIFP